LISLNNYDILSGCRKITNGVPQGWILDPFFSSCLICINNLPMATDSDTKVVLFADHTSSIITSPNKERLQTALNKTLSDINLWFKDKFL